MPDVNRLAANELRAYPLVAGRPPTMSRSDAGEVDLPEATLVDFRSALGPAAGWRVASDAITLHQVRRVGDRFEFEFRATAPALAGYAATFDRALDGPEFARETVDAAPAVLGSAGSTGSSLGHDADAACPPAVLWMATLVTGRLDDLAAVLASGQSLTDPGGLMAVEPALVQDLAGSALTSLNVGNFTRIHATAPADCDPYPDPEFPDGTPRVYKACLTGTILLRAGYNASIRQGDDNSLTIGAVVGGTTAGIGAPCVEVATYPREPQTERPVVDQDITPTLAGGPTCGDVITGINGLAAAALALLGGTGITIRPDPDRPHTLIVEAGTDELAVCPAFIDSSYPSDG